VCFACLTIQNLHILSTHCIMCFTNLTVNSVHPYNITKRLDFVMERVGFLYGTYQVTNTVYINRLKPNSYFT
jgi:hypothetical protein